MMLCVERGLRHIVPGIDGLMRVRRCDEGFQYWVPRVVLKLLECQLHQKQVIEQGAAWQCIGF